MRPTITAIVMCYNEADFVYPCLQQILPLADQTIIWDGNFWIGNKDMGRPDILTEASSDNTRDLISRAVDDFGVMSKVEILEYEGLPKMAESDARNVALQHATGDYALIVDCDELWTEGCFTRLRELISENPDVTDFFIKNRLYFWNPFFYVLTKHMRLFKLRPGREFYGANEVTGNEKQMVIPSQDDGLFHHYGYINPETVKIKMTWYDRGPWRNCGSQWFENIFQAFDGTLEGAQDLFDRNYGTLHPWGRTHPGFAADEFTPLFDPLPVHPSAIRQYFDKRGFDTSLIHFIN